MVLDSPAVTVKHRLADSPTWPLTHAPIGTPTSLPSPPPADRNVPVRMQLVGTPRLKRAEQGIEILNLGIPKIVMPFRYGRRGCLFAKLADAPRHGRESSPPK